MNSIIPNMTEALLVHETAHEQKSPELHGTALKLLALCNLEHVALDDLDSAGSGGVWNELPGAICVEGETVALLGPARGIRKDVVAVVDSNKMATTLAGQLPVDVTHESYFQHKTRTPAYGTFLIRMDAEQEIVPEKSFTVGEYVPVGYPRKHGAYRFPVVAHDVEPGYKMFQVHKDGDIITIFDKEGVPVRGMADVIDKFVAMDTPAQAIFECVYYDGHMLYFDVLYCDGMDCTKLTLKERTEMGWKVAEIGSPYADWLEFSYARQELILNQDELHALAKGMYIIRFADEVLDNLIRPFWFEHNAGTVEPGTVMPWISPHCEAPSDMDADGCISVPCTDLPTMQIHKKDDHVSVFIGEGGRNRLKNMPQLLSVTDKLPDDCIIECMWTGDHNGVALTRQKTQKPAEDQDLSDYELTIYPYDIVFWGQDDLSDLPMYERMDKLESFIDAWDCLAVHPIDQLQSDTAWLFDPDAPRHMDGTKPQCWTKKLA